MEVAQSEASATESSTVLIVKHLKQVVHNYFGHTGAHSQNEIDS